MKRRIKQALLIGIGVSLIGCAPKNAEQATETTPPPQEEPTASSMVIEAEAFTQASANFAVTDGMVTFTEAGWLAYDLTFAESGRYRVEVVANGESTVWLEDYTDNTDGRTYNVTGSVAIPAGEKTGKYGVDGSPFAKGLHKMKLHAAAGAKIDKLQMTLLVKHEPTPESLTQKMDGKEWAIVWADEFDGTEIDTQKWTYDLGDWGWGNNELQYYTNARKENARIENGNLVIEARKGDMGQKWTSARLTTRGKTSFLYGKIEFRAKVPREKGNWAAGWTLGDDYVDEINWPYCGEIDILESVGYEVNDQTGDGIAHATVHTPAYYFKINNQISSTKDIKNIAGEFHTYAVEWTPTEIRGYVDGQQYYLYDKNANEKEWPFAKPQNIILNLAMGGGWGGAQGMDPTVTSQQFLLDYVRVYELR